MAKDGELVCALTFGVFKTPKVFLAKNEQTNEALFETLRSKLFLG